MEKTKLGITISLFGGGLYFLGLMGIIPIVVAAGYVLLCEENQWLRRVAVKAVAVVLFFAIVSAFVGLFSDATLFLSNLWRVFDNLLNVSRFNAGVSVVQTVVTVLRTLCLLMLGFRALKMRDISIGPVDALIDKNR